MQARFLLGPAGSGKTFRCLAEIRAALTASPEGPPLLLLAPKQATFQLERQLLANDELPGYTRLQILSFERLAEFILAEFTATSPRLLDEEGRVMVLRALLARRQRELKIFRATARLPGFARELSLLLRELQRHHLLDRRLAALAVRADLPESLRAKLHDLALLLRAYLDWLAENHLQDANCLLDLATTALRESRHPPSSPTRREADTKFVLRPSSFVISSLWLDGFAEMTPQEMDFLAVVVPSCERATLAFCLDGEPAEKTPWLSPWAVIGRTFRSCYQRLASLADCDIEVETLRRTPGRGRFASSPALAYLEANWSQQSSNPESSGSQSTIRVVECANPEAEAVLAAREILRHVRGGGRFRDCAVLLRSLEGYHHELRRVFQRYQIPYFLDRREPVAHHPLAELTRFALRVVAFGWEHDDWFGALKTGLVTADEAELDALENEALARGWTGDFWRKPIQIHGASAVTEPCERLRRKIVPPFENLAAALAAAEFKPTGRQLAQAIRGLWDDAHADETLERWSSVPAGSSAVHATVREQMGLWLENLELAFPTEALSLGEWLPILEAGLASLTVGVIPPALDQVLVGAIDRSRNPELKLALLPGLNEGVFPAPPVVTGLLTESDRLALEDRGVELGAGKLAQLGHERYYGYIACTRASERLVLTCAQRDASDSKLNRSPFLAHLKRLFPGLEVEEFHASADWPDAEHASELAAPLIQLQNTQSQTENGAGLLKLPALAALAENLRGLRAPLPTESLSPELADRLYGSPFKTSVSAIERFAACPFRFFIHSGLRAEERQLFEADARERGSFQHEVLRRFHDAVRAQGCEWRQISPVQARELVGRIAARVMDELREGLFRASPESVFAARSLTAALQDFTETVIGWMPDYGFDPRAVELSFGFDGDPLPAWEIDLGNGKRLAFRGKIDRIDLAAQTTGSEANCVVIDYKSGGKKIDPLLLEHGVQIQLPAYLATLRHVGTAAPEIFGNLRPIPVGAFYVNLRGDYPTGATRSEVLAETDDARRRAYRHTGRFSLSALRQLDLRAPGGNSGQFNYALTKNGTPNRIYKDLLESAEFTALLDHVENLLRSTGRRIFAGEAAVDPYRKGGETACDFCECRAICRIDPWLHQFRVLKPSSPSSSRKDRPSRTSTKDEDENR